MIIFLLALIFISLYIFFKLYKVKKVFNKKKILRFNKANLYKWMNLTKKERYDFSNTESFSYFKKRKVLLDQIRKEYKSISKSDPKKLS